MARIVRCSLIQAANVESVEHSLQQIKQAMIEKHVGLIRKAAKAGAQIACLQEIFYGPYFCAEQDKRWYDTTEPVPTVRNIAFLDWKANCSCFDNAILDCD